jgi:hypothetical protein
MRKADIEILGESSDGWCGHCYRHRKIVVEAAVQWPDYPDYLVEGCLPCIEEIALGLPRL